MSKENAEIKKVSEELYTLAENCGIAMALKLAFGKDVSMSLPIPKEFLDREITMFDFPARVTNILSKWCKLSPNKPTTVERIVSLVAMGDYAKQFVSGYGKKAQNFLKTFLLTESYERYSDRQKKEFCYNVILLNCDLEVRNG